MPFGFILIAFSILDVFINSFFEINLTSAFAPISTILPLFLGFFGFYLIRIEYAGIKHLDLLNKNINTNNFNAFLTLIIIFTILKVLPEFLSWFIFDANISGNSSDACTGSGACWTYIKVWLRRFIYGMYPNAEQWRINIAFISFLLLGLLGIFSNEKTKNF